ncbi:MAG: ABC transporter permease [Planctomycetota bacterium]|nr:MAG: ABC transporter permease [Planctomycetota bacterium]
MISWDLLRLCAGSLGAHRLRTALSVLGVAVGVLAVILLTTVGEGTRGYVVAEFAQFGTNLLSVNPGKSETLGLPGVLGGTTHKLTIDDAEAVARLPEVQDVVMTVVGQGAVEAGGRSRSVFVYGVTASAPRVWNFEVRVGRFLPEGDPRRGGNVAVLGAVLKRELFGDENALGRVVRIAGARFRVVGVMAPRGKILGMDIDDVAYVPVATAMKLFNLDELLEINVTFAHEELTERVERQVRAVLRERHDGREDFTVTTQTGMLDVFGKVMTMITAALGAMGGISLLVGAVGILTMQWIAVGERTHEIGLLRAIGATRRQVLSVFLAEAVLVSALGGACGMAAGVAVTEALRLALPGLPLRTPPAFFGAGVAVSVLTGLAAGVLPARRAARLDPIEALRAE